MVKIVQRFGRKLSRIDVTVAFCAKVFGRKSSRTDVTDAFCATNPTEIVWIEEMVADCALLSHVYGNIWNIRAIKMHTVQLFVGKRGVLLKQLRLVQHIYREAASQDSFV